MRIIFIVISVLMIFNCENKKKLGKINRQDSILVSKYDTLPSNIWKDEGNVVLYNSVNGVKKWQLETDTLINNSTKGIAIVYPLYMIQYDSVGHQIFEMTGKKGYYAKKIELIIATDSVRMKFYTGEQWGILLSDSLVLKNKKLLKAYPVKLKIFKSDSLFYNINGDSGEYYPDLSKVLLKGHVNIKYVKRNVELYCEDLLFDKNMDLVKSNGHVKFRQNDGTFIEGDGFVSDKNFDNWKILKNIKGEVRNVSFDENNL